MPLTVLRPSDRTSCSQIWQLIDLHRERAAASVRRAARGLGLSDALERVVVDLAGFGAGAAQRAALCTDDWAPYEDQLRAHGIACAETGIELHSWLELIDVYQAALLDSPLAAPGEVRATLAQLRAYVMANIVQAYARVRSTTARELDGASTLFGELFHNTPTPTLIYRLADRSRAGSISLLFANAAAAPITHSRLLAEVARGLQQGALDSLGSLASANSASAPAAGSWHFTVDSGPPANRAYIACCFPLGASYLGLALEDITDRRRMEDDVQRHVRELERSNRELDDFAHAASHDLKSPLVDVKNLCEWIREDLGRDLPADTGRHMGLVLDRLARMERLLDDLLAYSRAGRQRAPAEQFAFRDMIADVIALKPLPPSFGVDIQADIGTLRTPKSPLAQVVRNLIANAIKHHDRDRGRITIEATEAGDRILVAVSDDGPGIPSEFHDRVFRIFQTLRPRDEVEGSGVGLALVKKLVETHGGSVAILSQGRGTTVRFSWPRESEL